MQGRAALGRVDAMKTPTAVVRWTSPRASVPELVGMVCLDSERDLGRLCRGRVESVDLPVAEVGPEVEAGRSHNIGCRREGLTNQRQLHRLNRLRRLRRREHTQRPSQHAKPPRSNGVDRSVLAPGRTNVIASEAGSPGARYPVRFFPTTRRSRAANAWFWTANATLPSGTDALDKVMPASDSTQQRRCDGQQQAGDPRYDGTYRASL